MSVTIAHGGDSYDNFTGYRYHTFNSTEREMRSDISDLIEMFVKFYSTSLGTGSRI